MPDNAKPRRMTRPLKAAVVGSGGISQEHLSFLSGKTVVAGDVSDRVKLAAVCDLSPAAAKYGATKFGAEASYTDMTKMLEQASPDVVHILTPPQSHVALVTEALASGAHVICEKPITPTSEELRKLQAVADEYNRHLLESHNYRFNSGVVAIKEMIDDGDLGDVREVEIRVTLPVTDPGGRFGDPNMPSPIHKMPAGVIHDFTTHLSYLMLHLTGDATFTKVGASWNNHSESPIFRYDNLDAIMIGSSDTGPVHGRLRFESDAAPDGFTIVVRGTRGYAETDLFQPYLRAVIPRTGGGQLSPIANHIANGLELVKSGVTNVGKKIMQKGPYHGLHQMLDDTYAALVDGNEMPVTPQQMLRASMLVDQLLAEESRV